MMSKALIALPSSPFMGILAGSSVTAFVIKDSIEVVETKDNEAFNFALCAEWPSLNKKIAKHRTHESIKAALKTGDYDAWIKAVSALPNAPKNLREIVTEADFEILVEIHALNNEGEYEAAKALKEKLDLPSRHRICPPLYPGKNF